jgi:hypothetical protein
MISLEHSAMKADRGLAGARSRIMRWYVAGLAFAAALAIESAAHAATISIRPAANGEPALVIVDGDLQANDGDQFRSKTSFLSKAIISFRSAGGSV